MINSIGLPNKGLDGYLAEDLPRLAELPVPLIVNVMGSTRRGGRDARRGVRRARRGRGARAQRLLPERQDRAADGRRPGGDRGAARRGPPADREAADREAHAELRLAGGGRRGGRAARRRRGLADQHAARDGDAPAPAAASPGSAAAPAACRARRSARSRSRRCARCASASGSRSSAWAACRAAATRATCSTPAQISSASGPSPSATRSRAPGSRPSCAQIDANSGIVAGHEPAHSRIAQAALKKPCKACELPSSALHAAAPQLEVELNSGVSPCRPASRDVDSPPMPPATKTPPSPPWQRPSVH